MAFGCKCANYNNHHALQMMREIWTESMAYEGAHINLQVLYSWHLEEALDWSKDLSCCCPAALCHSCCCDLPGKVKVLVLAVNLHMQKRCC